MAGNAGAPGSPYGFSALGGYLGWKAGKGVHPARGPETVLPAVPTRARSTHGKVARALAPHISPFVLPPPPWHPAQGPETNLPDTAPLAWRTHEKAALAPGPHVSALAVPPPRWHPAQGPETMFPVTAALALSSHKKGDLSPGPHHSSSVVAHPEWHEWPEWQVNLQRTPGRKRKSHPTQALLPDYTLRYTHRHATMG
jgi:hypothetical protein